MAVGRARPPAGLVLTASPAWPELSAMLGSSAVSVEVLPIDPTDGESCLRRIRATVDGWLGAMALHAGGLLLDHGWLRVFGGGCPRRRMPGLADVNPEPNTAPYLLVGADVLGGRYAIRGGSEELPGKPGEICYLGPDTLRWEALGWSYRDWLSLMVGGAVMDFYHDLRWPGWEVEVPQVPLDQLLSLYPPVYTPRGRASLASAERTPVPSAELYGLIDELSTEKSADKKD